MWRALVPYLAYAYITLVGWTTRTRFEGLEHLEAARRRGSRVLYAFWHQRQVFFTWSHRGSGAAVLVSRSRDGEMIARTMALSGLKACRGSSSRGAAAGTRELLEAVSEGRDIGISPDGPRGPAREIKPGVLYLAAKLGLPIVPIANANSRRLEIARAWDRFQVPLPFGRAAVVHGPALVVAEGDDHAARAAELKAALDRVTAEAERLVGRP